MTFDYIVIGAGSAGCAVAARLSENPVVNVLLLESGGTNDLPEVNDPVKWPTILSGTLDWNFMSTPMKSCLNRVDHVPRARMLGGCHSHNASVWVRGHNYDFDSWEAMGNPGWGWQDVLPVYKRIENWQSSDDPSRGKGGPMWVQLPAAPNPVAAAFVESGPYVGIPKVFDYNSGDMEGVSFFNFTIKDGKRFSVVHAYLLPAAGRKNLTVVMNATTHKLVTDGTRCSGVEYSIGGKVMTAAATKEVVLSAGVIGSPAILLRSGIGPAADLKALGIPVVLDLPGVGANLQDHVLFAGINYECKIPLPAANNNGAESTMWWKTDPKLKAPNIQPVILEFPFATPDTAHLLPNQNCYAIAPSIIHPESRGSVKINSTDPMAAPVIDVNYYDSQRDVEEMLFAIELCREMGASPAFNDLRKQEVIPGKLDRAAMITMLKNGATTYFHPVGTCTMGNDNMAVVDAKLKLHGISNLRVADASIMPVVTRGNTNAPSVLIGERCADFMTAV